MVQFSLDCNPFIQINDDGSVSSNRIVENRQISYGSTNNDIYYSSEARLIDKIR